MLPSRQRGPFNLALFGQSEMSQALGTDAKPLPAGSQDSVCLTFAVESVDDAYTYLRGQGIEFVASPTDHPEWGIRTAHLRDPDGTLIEINHSLQR